MFLNQVVKKYYKIMYNIHYMDFNFYIEREHLSRCLISEKEIINKLVVKILLVPGACHWLL